MKRLEMVTGCVFAFAAWSCTQDLTCTDGTVEINSVCECPGGTIYVQTMRMCVSTPTVGTSDASTGVGVDGAIFSTPMTDGGSPLGMRPPTDGAPPNINPCANDWILCGDTCVDPKQSANCGRCDNTCRVGAVCEQKDCREVGCSDGTREAFADSKTFPTIAGCAATWPAASMRAVRQIGSCGNSLGGCRVPVDACAAGWHVCGDAPSGPADMTSRVTEQACNSEKGRFAAALGDHSCNDCGSGDGHGAVCCGDGCVMQKGSCLWPSRTGWFGIVNGFSNYCASAVNPIASQNIGVLCCKDGK